MRSIGEIISEAWDMITTLEGATRRHTWGNFDGESERPRLPIAEWRGDRYVKIWNFRTGLFTWTKLPYREER